MTAAKPIVLTTLGDPNAVVCEGDVCALPASSGASEEGQKA